MSGPTETNINSTNQPTIALNRLQYFAQYLEQSIIFGDHDPTVQQDLEAELGQSGQRLSEAEIEQLTQQILANSAHTVSRADIEALFALQAEKTLDNFLRSIVLTAHQRTGALTGQIGVHTRISAETDANAATNLEVVMQVLSHVRPGNRLVVMDMVKATADESKLRAPDIFETDVYGQHRNGLIDNHAWNLQKLVRAIRDRELQHRTTLILRLDGPDEGANANVFNPASLEKYRLAIAKLIRYLETTLPLTPFKLVLGNEPDLPYERPWSDPNVDPRLFAIGQFAPAMGAFMQSLAQQRPDVTLLCPALSKYLKTDQLDYFTAFFGQSRPENLIPALHGYGDDVLILPGNPMSLVETQTEILHQQGQFKHVSITEMGSPNPMRELEALSDRRGFDDVLAWLLLSTRHRPPPGQSNSWAFYIDPASDDPTARQLADAVNRSQTRILRNIRQQDGANLSIVTNHTVYHPTHRVKYLDHDTPTTMVAGQTQVVPILVRNITYDPWPAGGSHPVRLGYHWYTLDGQTVPAYLWDDHRTRLSEDLVSGDRAALQAKLGPPRIPGTYEVRWDMVEEGRTWFAWQGSPTLNVQITVKAEGVEPPEPGAISVRASHNNRQAGPDNLQQAIDNNPATRWSTLQPQQPGMWFQIDLGELRTVSQIRLDNGGSPLDYPRGYILRVSTDGQSWTSVAEKPANDRPLEVTFTSRQIRFVRIEQTGRDPVYWWSIHEIHVSEAEVTLSARASHNNVLTGADNLLQALDNRPDTRWSSRALQQPGMWFEIDLNKLRSVSGLALDTAGSPNDYPRGYVVSLSTDGQQWVEVARNDRNDRALDIKFTPRSARFIRIEQTGRADRWWWSIHRVTIKE